jgi:hypothetical protein
MHKDIRMHPNFRYIVMNRNGVRGFTDRHLEFDIIVKNPECPGQYLNWNAWTNYAFTWSDTRAFEQAAKYYAKVYVRTEAGDIEIFAKDFQ